MRMFKLAGILVAFVGTFILGCSSDSPSSSPAKSATPNAIEAEVMAQARLFVDLVGARGLEDAYSMLSSDCTSRVTLDGFRRAIDWVSADSIRVGNPRFVLTEEDRVLVTKLVVQSGSDLEFFTGPVLLEGNEWRFSCDDLAGMVDALLVINLTPVPLTEPFSPPSASDGSEPTPPSPMTLPDDRSAGLGDGSFAAPYSLGQEDTRQDYWRFTVLRATEATPGVITVGLRVKNIQSEADELYGNGLDLVDQQGLDVGSASNDCDVSLPLREVLNGLFEGVIAPGQEVEFEMCFVLGVCDRTVQGSCPGDVPADTKQILLRNGFPGTDNILYHTIFP